ATFALPTLAMAQAGLGNQGDTSGTIDNAGNPPGSYSAQGPVTYPGPRYITGQGYYGQGYYPGYYYGASVAGPGASSAPGPNQYRDYPGARYPTGQGYGEVAPPVRIHHRYRHSRRTIQR